MRWAKRLSGASFLLMLIGVVVYYNVMPEMFDEFDPSQRHMLELEGGESGEVYLEELGQYVALRLADEGSPAAELKLIDYAGEEETGAAPTAIDVIRVGEDDTRYAPVRVFRSAESGNYTLHNDGETILWFVDDIAWQAALFGEPWFLVVVFGCCMGPMVGLIGLILALVGWNRRRKPESPVVMTKEGRLPTTDELYRQYRDSTQGEAEQNVPDPFLGQAPASGTISLRTMPRNFPDRSGTKDDQVHLCSPETAAASALTGKITDPRDLEQIYDLEYPHYKDPELHIINMDMLVAPLEDGRNVELVKGPNIKSLPHISELQQAYEVPVLLKMGDNISTDEILKAGAEVLPFRSNLPEISKYSYTVIDDTFYDRAMQVKKEYGGHIVVAGENYAQGSSREHAALAPKYLGQVAVIAKNYARIAWQNLVNFGILPLEFINPMDYEKIQQGDKVKLSDLRTLVQGKKNIDVVIEGKEETFIIPTKHSLSDRQIRVLLKGGIINDFKEKLGA